MFWKFYYKLRCVLEVLLQAAMCLEVLLQTAMCLEVLLQTAMCLQILLQTDNEILKAHTVARS